MVSNVETCSNYVEKYLPLHLQRQLTQVLAFVFPGRDTAWRLNWFNELRMPMLSAALLTDEGRHNLSTKMKEMIALLSQNPTTIMEINSEDNNSQSKEELLKDE